VNGDVDIVPRLVRDLFFPLHRLELDPVGVTAPAGSPSPATPRKEHPPVRVFTRVPKALAAASLSVLVPVLAPGIAAAHESHPSPTVGYVYVNDNTAPANTVAGFARHADGTLTPLPGSPFATGGAGTGAGIGSQGALQRTDRGRYLLAVDAGSDQVSVLRTHPDGTLTPASNPVDSGGTEPVSVTVHRHLVYVANAGNGGSNYTGFLLRHGQLEPLADSTISLPDGSQPGDVLFSGDGTRVVGTRVTTSLIDSFAVDPHGRLIAAAGSPYAAQGQGPFGSEFRPTDPSELYVSNAHDGPGNGTVSAFRDSRDGSLTSIGSKPFANGQTAPCWVEISRDGRYLFSVNTAQPSISSYLINRDGSLTLLGNTGFRNPTKLGPVDARLSPDGKTLWVVDAGANTVSGFAVNDGQLSELPSSPTPLPGGATPFGIVVG
jgi:6-phosphogluconolactonase (cycloisomerase 2 family)